MRKWLQNSPALLPRRPLSSEKSDYMTVNELIMWDGNRKPTTCKIRTKTIDDYFLTVFSIANKLLETFHLDIISVPGCGGICYSIYKGEKQLTKRVWTDLVPPGYYLRAPSASGHIQPDGKGMSESPRWCPFLVLVIWR
jgi:hypothetical protein